MSLRKRPRVSRELQDAAAERWRERLEADAKPPKPPASGWRSMASAPRDGREIAVRYDIHTLVAVYEEDPLWPNQPWHVLERWPMRESELQAWAPLPEWTGEVSE